MTAELAAAGARVRVLLARGLRALGLRDESYLLVLAILIGIVTAAAAVGFHVLIVTIRDHLYANVGQSSQIYGRGIALLIVLPAVGGLVVGALASFVFRTREGHGVVDVMESVMRWRGKVRPMSAVEKILTSGITIGSGGSAGAEGPIVQIGAAIASGVGQLFRIARPHMPVLIGCGSAAGISAIFNAPIGGVFFTLEVILLDFSLRTFAPVVLASVIANITTKAIFAAIYPHEQYEAILALPVWEVSSQLELSWRYLGNFVVLGLVCGVIGVALTRLMATTEHLFARVKAPRWLKPGLGGAALGLSGVLYVVVFGWWLMDRQKPIDFADYPLPAFFSDGYGVIRQLVRSDRDVVPPARETDSGRGSVRVQVPLTGFYREHSPRLLLVFLGALCVLKLAGTSLTLSSGGSGGVIAPSLFLGATAGGFVGLLLHQLGADVRPNLYALVGMGAVLAAVIHAPLASILILLELTQDHKLILPAMVATVVATGVARMIFRDSVYTMILRARGVRVGTMADLTLLRRLCVEQVDLEPAAAVHLSDPLQEVMKLVEESGMGNFVVYDDNNQYAGMLVAGDLSTALLQREAVPLLLVEELVRSSVPLVSVSDDLATVLDLFSLHDVDHLPVSVDKATGRVIGLISRAGLMRQYQRAMAQE